MRKVEWLGVVFLIVCFGTALVVLGRMESTSEQAGSKRFGNGMFEWSEKAVSDPDSAARLCEKLDITLWYQELSKEQSTRQIRTFVKELRGQGVTVYALAGSKKWGFEQDGKSLIQYLEWMALYNMQVKENEKLQGIMVDVEPYVSERWNDDPEGYMSTYVSGMKQAYKTAREKDIRFIACIPNHYDDQGLETGLEELISLGCDGIAVMDYDCGQEWEKLQTEARLAGQYGKSLHCILEFQKVGKHGLTEEETYYNKGLDAAAAAWDAVEQALGGYPVMRDYHWSNPVRELLAEK